MSNWHMVVLPEREGPRTQTTWGPMRRRRLAASRTRPSESWGTDPVMALRMVSERGLRGYAPGQVGRRAARLPGGNLDSRSRPGAGTIPRLMSGASASRVTRVGEITVVALPDGAADLQGWPMSADLAPGDPVDWAAYAARNPGGFHGPEHKWRIHNTCFAVLSGGETTLVDCGVGAGPYPWYAGLRGKLPASLAAAGLAPGDRE